MVCAAHRVVLAGIVAGALVSCMPAPMQIYLVFPDRRFVAPAPANDWPISESKELPVAAGTVLKTPEPADPWYCDDSWRYDPGFEATLTPSWSDDPFYATGAAIPIPSYRLDPGLGAWLEPNWRLDSGF